MAQLIDDTPAKTDNFQSHSLIANSLYSLIAKNGGGKTIGLEGKWGAGKSTVVKLLQQNIKEEGKLHFFSFDSWVHQDDPLRRSFLEELITAAINGGWLQPTLKQDVQQLKEHWEEERANLARKIKDVDKRIEPRSTKWGIAMLLSLTLVPVGIPLLNATLSQILKDGPSVLSAVLLLFAVVFLLGPMVVLLFSFLVTSADEKHVLSVFLQKGFVKEKVFTSESQDRSTLEFQTIFASLMAAVLTKKEQRLVIVLDNLDRLSIDEAKAVWPMLRSFIDNPAFSELDWFKRLWVIVPHDREALEASVAKTDTPTPDLTSVQGKHIEGASSHFLDKVFQLKVFVPAPVLSNWRNYLEQKLDDAFKTESHASMNVIYLLLTRWYSFSNPPGPREIINIVNGMVATKTLWSDKVPGVSIKLEHHAYFSILKRERSIPDLRSCLLNRTINLHEDLLGVGIEDSLFALETNTPPEEAKQILYRPLIEDILVSKDARTQLVAKYIQPGFAAVFDACIGEILTVHALADPSVHIQIAQCILGGDFFDTASEFRKIALLEAIKSSLKRVLFLPISLPECVQFLETLVKCDGERAILQETIRKLLETSTSQYFVKNKSDMKAMLSAHAIWTSAVLRTYLNESIPRYAIGKSTSDFIDHYIELDAANATRVLDAFDTAEMPEKIASELSEDGVRQRDWNRISYALQYIEKIGIAIPGAVFDQLSERILNNIQQLWPEDMTGVLPYLLERSKSHPQARNALNKLYGSTYLNIHLHAYHPSSDVNFSDDFNKMIQWHTANRKHICGRLFYLISKDYPNDLNREVYRDLFLDPEPDMEILEGLKDVLPRLPNPDDYLKHLAEHNMDPLVEFLKTGSLRPGIPLMASP